MATIGTINLIKTKTSSSPQFDALEATLKKVSYGALIVFIVLAVAVGSTFFYLHVQSDQLGATKASLTQSVSRNRNIEGLLLSIHERAGIVDKIIENQKPVGALFDTVGNIVPISQLVSMTLDNNNETILIIHVKSVDDVVSVVDALLKTVQQKQAKSPKLLSFTLGRDGSIEVSVSFVAVL